MRGTLIEFTAEGDYEALIADLKRRLKEANIESRVRRKRARRALVEGMSPKDAATFMYLACVDFRIIATDVGTDEPRET